MARLVVVGSGPSGVHYSLSALEQGHEVFLLDVGYTKEPAVQPKDRFEELKEHLKDPVEYFLGKEFESVLYPGTKGEYYGFPPNKKYVFAQVPSHRWEASGFSPLSSFARGGLAEAWTGGVYPFNEDDLRDFPFSYEDIASCYSEVARRIGISGVQDDLATTFPVHDHLQEPLALDGHSTDLLSKYHRKKRVINGELNCVMGRARLAALSQDFRGRKGCSYLGRCLWGCPQESFYTPTLTLADCQKYGRFHYLPRHYVRYFRIDSRNRVSHVVARNLDSKDSHEMEVDVLVLASGTLSSSRIFLEAVRQQTGEVLRLSGLMDNQQILMPFVNWDFIGKSWSDASYQYHQIALEIQSADPSQSIHGLITTLKSALVHPLIHRAPCNLRFATFIFRNLHAALGLVNINLSDSRRETNFLTLKHEDESKEPALYIKYSPASGHPARIQQAIGKVKRLLKQLGCFVPPGMVHVRPMGASVHYAGTLPMSQDKKPLTVSPTCQSHDFHNLYIVDGSTFPFLPAKNITFSLMANAIRVAQQTL